LPLAWPSATPLPANANGKSCWSRRGGNSTGAFFRCRFFGRCSNRRGRNRATSCETALNGGRKWTWKATQNRSANAGKRGRAERWRSLLSRIWWCRLQVRNAACGMIVQIYEVTTPAEVRALGAMGVDHIGVLVGEGSFPREQTIEKAREIFAAIPTGSKASALSLSRDVDLIVRLTAALLPDILHLGAAPQYLSPEQLLTLKAEFPQISLMRSIPVVDESSIALARSYDGIADWLLLDSYKSGDRQIGAMGVTHSWELDGRIIESVSIPVIIAGGLGPENVREA